MRAVLPRMALLPTMMLALFAVSVLVTCTRIRPLPVLGQVDQIRDARASQEAREFAPQAFAHAEKLRQEARAAQAAKQPDQAQILAEHAIASYEHATVLSRLLHAQERLDRANEKLKVLDEQLQAADERQTRLLAEAESLELKVKVAQNALPLPTAGKASKERTLARRKAARALASEARLLCLSTKLLDPKADVGKQIAELDSIEDKMRKDPLGAAIEQAIALRSKCLKRLTDTRRPLTQEAPAAGEPDALLQALSKMGGLFPFRDDRGVVVVLRELFLPSGTALTPQAEKTIEGLGRVAKTHAQFPVLVVMHTDKGDPGPKDEQQALALKNALAAAGASRVDVRQVGDAQPLRSPKQAGAAERNRRIEVVFVAPSY